MDGWMNGQIVKGVSGCMDKKCMERNKGVRDAHRLAGMFRHE